MCGKGELVVAGGRGGADGGGGDGEVCRMSCEGWG